MKKVSYLLQEIGEEIGELVDTLYASLFAAAVVDPGGPEWNRDCDAGERAYDLLKARLAEFEKAAATPHDGTAE